MSPGRPKIDRIITTPPRLRQAPPAPEPPTTSSYPSRKTIALILLVCQNASVSLLTRLSRVPRPGQVHLYNASAAVFTAELLKLAVSFSMLVVERRQLGRAKKGRKAGGYAWEARMAVWDLFVNQRAEILKLSVPAALYALQNTLLYTALSNLDAASYQTTYQLKLLTTALFSVAFFRTSLSPTKWFSLLLLTVGVATVQLESSNQPVSASERHATNPRVGLAAILAACVSSGLAGAWFEYVLKAPAPPPPSDEPPSTPNTPLSPTSPDSPSSPSSATSSKSRSSSRSSAPLQLRQNSPSLWARNVQLSVPSLCFSFSGVLLSPDWSRISEHGLLEGFSPLVWGVVANQALGGLLVAMVVREANSVAKGFATSIAIVLSTLAGVVFLGLVPGWLFVTGASLVISSTILYAMDTS